MEMDPVSTAKFFGRQEVLNTLQKRFEAFREGYRHNLAVLGAPFIGKSSILRQFLRSNSDENTIPIFICIEEVDSFQAFLQKWLASVLQGYRRFLGLPAIGYQLLIRGMSRKLPRVVKEMRVIRALAQSKQFEAAYRQLLRLPQLLHDETGKRILLVIDEFDRLKHLCLSDPFAPLGSEVMLQKETMFVLASSDSYRAREVLKEKMSLLFSNFEVLDVQQFSFEEAEQWIRERLGAALEDRFVVRLLLHLTDGHPLYLDVLLNRLEGAVYGKESGPVTERILTHVLERELFQSRGILHQHFLMRLFSLTRNRFSFGHGDVLLAVALGKKRALPISTFLGRSAAEVKKILQRLLNEGYLKKKGSFYDVTDTLFRFWLCEVYYRKRISFDADYDEVSGDFRSVVASYISRMQVEEKKDLPFRIEDLFKRFRNEMVELGPAKMKCPKFLEVRSKPSNGRMFPVLAKGAQTKWLCQVVKGRLEENDVRTFLDDVSRVANGVHKKLMIALQGIELNAKLLAKESRIELWDLKDLNSLLDVYGCAKVIL